MTHEATEKNDAEKTRKQPVSRSKKIGMILLMGLLVISTLVVIWFQLTKYHDAMMQDRKDHIKALVENAHGIITMYKEKVDKELITLEEAQHYAKETLKGLRHNQYEYFWLTHVDGTVVMHPVKPELNGKNLESTTDANGYYLFREFTRIAKDSGAGYVSYVWPKPTDPSGPSYPKISYVKGFAAWDWIIGSGVYSDDVERSFRQAAYVAGALALAVLFLMVTLWFTVSENFVE